jgi:hypothetical protein
MDEVTVTLTRAEAYEANDLVRHNMHKCSNAGCWREGTHISLLRKIAKALVPAGEPASTPESTPPSSTP